MKRSKKHLLRSLVAAMIVCAGVASCSQDDYADKPQGELLPPGEYPLILTAGGLEVVATPAQKSAPSTRATVDDDWNGVNSVAVMVNGVVKEYEVTPSGSNNTTAKLEVKGGNEPFYWQNTADLAVEAWWPCTDEQNNFSNQKPEKIVVKADQNKDNGYAKSDFIKASADVKFNNPTLTFEHQTAKIIVNLTEAVGGVEFNNATEVQLLNVDGVENVNNRENTTITTYRPNNLEDAYYALLPQQKIGTTAPFIQVNTGGNKYRWTPTEEKELSPGMVYTYNISVTNTGLDVTVTDGISWGNGETGDLTITIPDVDEVIDLSQLTGPYTISDNRTYLITGSGTQNITISGSPTVYLSDANITPGNTVAPISVDTGEPVFILKGENTLTSSYQGKGALHNAAGTIITIEGDGKLIAKGATDAAAIGSGDALSGSYGAGGKIIIQLEEAGIIEAIPHIGGPAIGAGAYGGSCEGIDILGGTVIVSTDATMRDSWVGAIGAGISVTGYTSGCDYINLKNCTIYCKLGDKAHSVFKASKVTPAYNEIPELINAGVTIYVNGELYTKE